MVLWGVRKRVWLWVLIAVAINPLSARDSLSNMLDVVYEPIARTLMTNGLGAIKMPEANVYLMMESILLGGVIALLMPPVSNKDKRQAEGR